MIIQPMIRNNICLNAHPRGCVLYVQQQIDYARKQGQLKFPKRVLIIGSSAGYGLASRIVSTFSAHADTLGIAFERPASGKRTASAGWYANEAFLQKAKETGLYAHTIIDDAFAHSTKEQAVQAIKEHMGQIDLLIYSLASPIRIDPDTGERYTSVLKPIGSSYSSLSADFSGNLRTVEVAPANDTEIRDTVKVMGGEDWELWIRHLQKEQVLAKGIHTVAYSYIGPELTYALYRQGTIGKAKEDLEARASTITALLSSLSGVAYVSVNKALVTRASAVIPVVPLYLAILYKIMQEKNIHEACIEQMYRLFASRLNGDPNIDLQGRIRMDDWELRKDVQDEVNKRWKRISPETAHELADFTRTQQEFLQIHGFSFDQIDYTKDETP